jgi:hypothetical protein
MAEQNRHQQNRQQDTPQSAPSGNRDRVPHQRQTEEPQASGTKRQDEAYLDEDTRGMGQTDKERTNREPASVANDSGLGDRADRFGGDQQEELDDTRDPDLALDESEEGLDDTGRRNR